MINKIYTAECYVQNVNVEFYVNDIPISLRGPGLGNFWGAPINQYLVNKNNTISVIVKPGDRPSRSKIGPITGCYTAYPGDTEKALMRICSYPKGTMLGSPNAEEVARIEWPVKRLLDNDLEVNDFKLNNYPLIKKEIFNIGNCFCNFKSFQKAPKLKLDDITKLSLAEFLSNFHECIKKGDAEKFIEFTTVRIRDNVDSYGNNINENISLIKNGVKRNAESEGWALEDLTPNNYDFRLCANDTMIHCIAKDWKPIVREAVGADNSCAYYDIFVSLIKKRWEIVL